MAATLEVGKLALSFIPNVEIVTLLCAVYGYIFGYYGVIATYIFVGIETLIWGVNTWVITYLIHWGCVTLVFMLFGKFKIKNRLIITATAVLLTAAFGVLSSLVDTGLLTGFWNNFWKRFAIMYVRGLAFYIVQIVCNLLLFLIVFNPMVNRIGKLLPDKFRNINDK
ncbi:MAG: hypothetical protein HDT29_04715 [Clostridiales bacterium]|nr:hypothetical protein [Clostridiales bacterium]